MDRSAESEQQIVRQRSMLDPSKQHSQWEIEMDKGIKEGALYMATLPIRAANFMIKTALNIVR